MKISGFRAHYPLVDAYKFKTWLKDQLDIDIEVTRVSSVEAIVMFESSEEYRAAYKLYIKWLTSNHN